MKTSISSHHVTPQRKLGWLIQVGICGVLLFATVFTQAESLPPVVERYEQMLVRSPGKGTSFDKVYQHYFEGEGVEKLKERWTAKLEGDEAATYRLLLGMLADRQGNAAEAIQLYQKVVVAKPEDARAWNILAEAQASAGRLKNAIVSFQKALENKVPDDLRPQLYRQLARSQQRAFDTAGALKMLHAAIKT